jgi:hypothetical protein
MKSMEFCGKELNQTGGKPAWESCRTHPITLRDNAISLSYKVAPGVAEADNNGQLRELPRGNRRLPVIRNCAVADVEDWLRERVRSRGRNADWLASEDRAQLSREDGALAWAFRQRHFSKLANHLVPWCGCCCPVMHIILSPHVWHTFMLASCLRSSRYHLRLTFTSTLPLRLHGCLCL